MGQLNRLEVAVRPRRLDHDKSMASGGTESVFESVGINQSVHRIYFELRATVSLLTPFTQTDCELTSSVCIAETVIIGEVPNVYFGSQQP